MWDNMFHGWTGFSEVPGDGRVLNMVSGVWYLPLVPMYIKISLLATGSCFSITRDIILGMVTQKIAIYATNFHFDIFATFKF